jgi:uncharacterized tellurite resistance protein B-like protein
MNTNPLIVLKKKLPNTKIFSYLRKKNFLGKFLKLFKTNLIYIHTKHNNITPDNHFYYYLVTDAQESYKHITFTFAYIALSAQLILIDGEPNEHEISELVNSFPVAANHIFKITELFYNACQDFVSKEKYAVQIYNLFSDNPLLLQQLINSLVKIALADKLLMNSEINWLKEIGNLLGFNNYKINELIEYHLYPADFDPYQALYYGDNEIDLVKLNKNYRSLAFIYHPDNLQQYSDISQQFVEATKKKFLAITTAYHTLKKELI